MLVAEIPSRDTFTYMLVRFDRDPRFEQREYGYSEVAVSKPIKWPKGMELPKRNPNQIAFRPADPQDSRVICALFIRQKPLKTRLVNLGWQEVTQELNLWEQEQQRINVVVRNDLGPPVSSNVHPPRDKKEKRAT